MTNTMWFGGQRLGATLVGMALLTALTSGATRGPDPSGYTATDATVYSFVELAGSNGGVSVLGDTDDGTVALTLPFPFQFYGVPRTLLCVSANGAAYFVADLAACAAIVDFANTDLSVTSSPGDTPGLFPLWSDLTFDQAGAGSVLYQTSGTPGSRRFVVEWHNAFPTGSASPVTFELILTEGSNQVLFQYQSVDLGGENPATLGRNATVGIRNANALVSGQQIQWSHSVPVIGNESAVLFEKQRRMSGSGFNAPELPAYRATFTVDVRGPAAAAGSLQYVYARTRMNFSSTGLTNVVLSGGNMTIEGTGSVNGVGGYTFTATVVDGSPDRFGLVIRRVSNGTVYYTTPPAALSGGTIALQ